MATYYNKNLIDGVSELPRMTQAEFDELSLDEKPINWICRNYTGTQRGIKSSDIEHGTGTVEDVLDLSTLTSASAISSGTTTANVNISNFVWDSFNPLLAIMSTRVSGNTTANLCILINISGTLSYKNIGDSNITGISLNENVLTVTMPTYANIFIIGKRKTV